MAKIVRYNGNLRAFASAAIGTERTLFGEVTQADDLTSQFTADFFRGWGIVGPSDQPTLEDFNALGYTHGQLLAYLHQIGVPEYNAAQEYHGGSMVQTGARLFYSLINNNVGNTPPSSPASWSELYPQATETVRGTAEIATTSEATAGTNDATIMTPLKVAQALAAQVSTDGISGSSSNLKLSSTGLSAAVVITANSICVKNATFGQKVLNAISLSPSFANGNGANGIDVGGANSQTASTWYSVWVIWNGTTTAGLLSLSATAPTMPAGYTHKARVGWVRTDATANKFPLGFDQRGSDAQYRVTAGTNLVARPVAGSGVAGSITTPTYVAIAVAALVPSTATAIKGTITQTTVAAGAGIIVAPTADYGAIASQTNPPIASANAGTAGNAAVPFDMILSSANIYWASSSAGNSIVITGWRDNL